jgi:purine-binding chemotaxis protein CheW
MTTDLIDQSADAESSVDTILDDGTSDIRQFVTFLVGEEVFAVDMGPVQEIIRLPDVVRVPLAPATLDGLANLRGKLLPIISLRRLFDFEELTHNDSTRAVVVDYGEPLGFVVDRVASVVGVDPDQIEDASAIQGTIDSDLLSGVIKNVGGHAMVMVLNFEKLIHNEFAAIAAISKAAKASTRTALATDDSDENADETLSDELQLVSFEVSNQEYAISIEDVQEIVQVPENIVHIPRAGSHVLGVITLRNRLLPLVSLRSLFSLETRALDEKSRIVVLALGSATVGLVVDGVREVLRVPKNEVDSMPALLARDGGLSEISEICRMDGGKRLVSIISARNLFTQNAIKEALSNMKASDSTARADDIDNDEALEDDEQVVVFRLDKEEFGVPIRSVQEIVRVPEELTRVPHAPRFVEGVINLRGSVLPVIDLRIRLGLDRVERSDRQRIMVFLLNGVRTGFVVDQVAEVLRISKHSIEPAPALSSEQGKLLSRMANLEKQKRMVQLLDPEHLVDNGHLSDLASISDQDGSHLPSRPQLEAEGEQRRPGRGNRKK